MNTPKFIGLIFFMSVVIVLTYVIATIHNLQNSQNVPQSAHIETSSAGSPQATALVAAINNLRQQNGNLSPLRQVAKLEQSADAHTSTMNQCAGQFGTSPCFLHQVTQLNEPVYSDRILQAGYNWTNVAENISLGQTTPDQVVHIWMQDATHRDPMLNTGKYSDIGCSYLNASSADPLRIFWTCDFGSTTEVEPTITPTPRNNPSPTPIPNATATPLQNPSPTSSIQLMDADVDKDGCVGILDFNAWFQAIKTGVVRTGTFPDINKDGSIDIVDFNVWFKAMLSLSKDKLC